MADVGIEGANDIAVDVVEAATAEAAVEELVRVETMVEELVDALAASS